VTVPAPGAAGPGRPAVAPPAAAVAAVAAVPPAAVAAPAVAVAEPVRAAPGAGVLTGRAAAARAVAAPAAAPVAVATAVAAVRPRAAAAALDLMPESRRRGPGRQPRVGRFRGPVGLGQVACWQVAVIATVAVRGEPRTTEIAVWAGAALLAALTTARWGGRWAYQWCTALAGFLVRRRRLRAAAGVAPAAALLEFAGARIDSLRLGDRDVGVLSHAGGVTVLLEPVTPTALVGTGPVPLPDPTLLLPVAADGPALTCQLVVCVVPALTGADSSAAASYAQLTGNRIPLHQSAWLAVQARRDADHATDAVLHVALANSTRRLLRRLRTEGRPVEPLGADDLLPVVAAVTRLDLRPHRSAGPPPLLWRERWRGWEAAGVPHAAYRLRRMIDPARAGSLVADLTAVPAEAVTLSVAARRGPRGVEVELAVGVAAATPADLAAAGRAVSAAAGAGARVTRLDGFQRQGVGCLLPLGGFTPW
jgi:type VII secretion protein EccE